MDQQLSPQAQKALDAINALSLADQASVVSLATAELAGRINHLASTAPPEKLAKASSKMSEEVQAVRAVSATQSPAVGRIETIDQHQAVVSQISVNGQQLDTLLSEGSFNKSRSDQHQYAAALGYRMATRAENRAYVDSLLAKEEDKSINAAEANALKTYRDRYVRDDEGGLAVDGRRVYADGFSWFDLGHPSFGALFVRASAESK